MHIFTRWAGLTTDRYTALYPNKRTPAFDPKPYTVVNINASMVRARRSGHSITRNMSFYKRIPQRPLIPSAEDDDYALGYCPPRPQHQGERCVVRNGDDHNVNENGRGMHADGQNDENPQRRYPHRHRNPPAYLGDYRLRLIA